MKFNKNTLLGKIIENKWINSEELSKKIIFEISNIQYEIDFFSKIIDMVYTNTNIRQVKKAEIIISIKERIEKKISIKKISQEHKYIYQMILYESLGNNEYYL